MGPRTSSLERSREVVRYSKGSSMVGFQPQEWVDEVENPRTQMRLRCSEEVGLLLYVGMW